MQAAGLDEQRSEATFDASRVAAGPSFGKPVGAMASSALQRRFRKRVLLPCVLTAMMGSAVAGSVGGTKDGSSGVFVIVAHWG